MVDGRGVWIGIGVADGPGVWIGIGVADEPEVGVPSGVPVGRGVGDALLRVAGAQSRDGRSRTSI